MLKYTFGELFVELIIGGRWCSHGPCLQSVCPRRVTLSDPGTCTGGGRRTIYKIRLKAKHDELRERTPASFRSRTEFKSETQHSQPDIYMYSLIFKPAAWSIKAISHQARRSATFKYNYFPACNGRLHTNTEGW